MIRISANENISLFLKPRVEIIYYVHSLNALLLFHFKNFGFFIVYIAYLLPLCYICTRYQEYYPT